MKAGGSGQPEWRMAVTAEQRHERKRRPGAGKWWNGMPEPSPGFVAIKGRVGSRARRTVAAVDRGVSVHQAGNFFTK